MVGWAERRILLWRRIADGKRPKGLRRKKKAEGAAHGSNDRVLEARVSETVSTKTHR